MTFDPFEPVLVITLTNNIFYLWNIIDKKLTDWSQQYSNCLPNEFLCLQDKIIGCTFNPANNKIMILWTSNYFCLIDFSKKVKSKLNFFKCQGTKKLHDDDNDDHTINSNDNNNNKNNAKIVHMQLVTRYKQIMYLEFISPNSLVIVERTLVDVLEHLPPAFYVSKYGT